MSQLTFRASAAAAIALLVALLVALTGAPAVAAEPWPDGGSLYGISCDWSRSEARLDVMTLDTDSAVAQSTGFTDESFPYFCGYSSSWNRVAGSCVSYTVAREPDDARVLARTDLTTGRSTAVGPFDGRPYSGMSSVTVDLDGAAWGLAGNRLYSVNLADATTTLVATFDGYSLMGLTLNPADGMLYAQDNATVYRIDPIAHTIAIATTIAAASGGALNAVAGMAIDSGGAFWFSQVENGGADPWDLTYALWRASASLTDFERVGQIADGTGPVGVFALLALPATACPELPTLPLPDPPTTPAELAATGHQGAVGLVLGCAVLLAAGVVLIGRARRGRCENRPA